MVNEHIKELGDKIIERTNLEHGNFINAVNESYKFVKEHCEGKFNEPLFLVTFAEALHKSGIPAAFGCTLLYYALEHIKTLEAPNDDVGSDKD